MVWTESPCILTSLPGPITLYKVLIATKIEVDQVNTILKDSHFKSLTLQYRGAVKQIPKKSLY